MSWYTYDNGRSMGQRGAENGIVILDEEHGDGARITLERECRAAPFAITCGVYGWMVHTRFFQSEPEAQREFARMKEGLAAILRKIPRKTDPDADLKRGAVVESLSRFVTKFP